MTTQANIQLMQAVMGYETKSTTLYTEVLKQTATHYNVPFNKSSINYIDLKEELDSRHAKCINNCEVKINAIGMIEMDDAVSSNSNPPLTVKEKMIELAQQIINMERSPFLYSNVAYRNVLDAAYAMEYYLDNLPPEEICDEDKLGDIGLGIKYSIEFDREYPDFEDLRNKILDYELMARDLSLNLIDTKIYTPGFYYKAELPFEQIQELYETNYDDYDTPTTRYYSNSSRMGY